MKARDILIALSIKHQNNWEAMYQAILNKECDNLEQYLENVDTNEFVTIIDDDYPERIRQRYRPPFVL